MQNVQSKKFLTVKDYQEIIGCSRSTAWDHIYKGIVPSVKVGGKRLIPAARLFQILDLTPGNK